MQMPDLGGKDSCSKSFEISYIQDAPTPKLSPCESSVAFCAEVYKV